MDGYTRKVNLAASLMKKSQSLSSNTMIDSTDISPSNKTESQINN